MGLPLWVMAGHVGMPSAYLCRAWGRSGQRQRLELPGHVLPGHAEARPGSRCRRRLEAACRSAPAAPAAHAVDQRHRHLGAMSAAMPASPAPPRITASGAEALRRPRGRRRRASARAPAGSAASSRAGRRHRVDAGQRSAWPSACGQAREHRPPALAAGDDREATMARGRCERGFRQPADRHAGAVAQREQAGVAEAADQHRVGPARRARAAAAQASSAACCATA